MCCNAHHLKFLSFRGHFKRNIILNNTWVAILHLFLGWIRILYPILKTTARIWASLFIHKYSFFFFKLQLLNILGKSVTLKKLKTFENPKYQKLSNTGGLLPLHSMASLLNTMSKSMLLFWYSKPSINLAYSKMTNQHYPWEFGFPLKAILFWKN